MENTPYEFDREFQRRRMLHVIDHALTEKQRRMIRGYYFEGKSLPELAREQGINRVSAWRLFKRAEARMQKYLLY